MSNPLHRYFHFNGTSSSSNKAPYALVTGSTGGMGEEWAYQLAALGFNVVIQGRNRKKLENVKRVIVESGSKADVRLLVTEATIYPNEPLVKGLSDLLADPNIRLTIVINNLGVNTVEFPRLEDQTGESVAEIITANSIFPAEITRLCLPALKRHQPSLLVTVTSLAAWASPPYLSPYCGTKGFDVAFSRSLHNEMICEKQQVDVVCMAPGQVESNMCHEPISLMIPTSKVWVQSAIASLRSTWWTPRPAALIAPYKPHSLGVQFILWGPTFITQLIARNSALDLQRKYWDSVKKDK